MKIGTTLLGVYLVVSPILLGPSESLAQEPSMALQAKTADAVSILSKAAQGRARIIVQYRIPASPARATIGTAEENLEAVIAENQTIQDSILSAHFGALPPLTTADRGLTRMSITPAFAINASASEIEALANDNRVVAIELEQVYSPRLIQSVPLIGMTAAYANGATGNGWAVAVLDSGVEPNHKFITNPISEACYSTTQGTLGSGGSLSTCPSGANMSTAAGSGTNCNISLDGCEHGTHVAGIAVGSNTQFQSGQPPYGIARSAGLIAINVASQHTDADCTSNQKRSPCVLARQADVGAALDRVFSIRNTLPGGVQVASVNYSYGSKQLYSGNCDGIPISAITVAIDRLRSVGIPTIIAAGNAQSRTQIGQPACISSAIAVGSTSKTDSIAWYSNMSTQVAVLAPGGDDSSTASGMILSSVPAGYGCSNYTGPAPSTGGSYCYLQGTSMAAPTVAGAWAALRSAVPNANFEPILAALIFTGQPITDTRSGGSITKPRIQVDIALRALQLGGLITQTWDFGSGNSSTDAKYYWQLVRSDDSALNLKCLSRYGQPNPDCTGNAGAFKAPEGYKICASTIYMQSTGIPEPSTFIGALQDQTRQHAWYADFGNWAQPLSARVRFVLVRTTFDIGCMKDFPVFMCGVGANNRQGCTEVQLGGVLR